MQPHPRTTGFRFPAGSPFPLWRPFQVCLAPDDDKPGAEPQPLVPEDLTALDQKTLARTEADLLKKGKRLQDAPASAETVAELREVVGALGKVRAEVTRRAEEAAQHEDEKAALLAELEPAAVADVEDPEGTEPAEGETEGTEGEPAETAPAAPEPVGIAASADPAPVPVRTRPRAPSVRDIPANAIRPEHRPRLEAPRSKVTITASGDVPGFSAGMALDESELGKAFADKAWSMLRGAPKSRDYSTSSSVVSIGVEYPEERTLRDNDTTTSNMAKIEAVTASGARKRGLTAKGPNAIVAAGGLCAPVAVDYSLMTLGTPARPVKDALVRFGAERGGLRFITPPHLSDVAPGVSLWTHQTDAAWTTGMPTKPFVIVTCGTETVVQVDAITLGIVVGNFDRMTFPEHFAAWYKLAQVYFGRFADSHLLDQIATASVATNTTQDLGAARDILVHLGTAAAGYRSRNRMETDEILQVLLPAWTRDLMRADFTRQHPGDEAVQLADGEINGYLAASNLEPTWYLDGPNTGVNQIFTSQGAGSLEGFPGTVQAFMFAPGSFLHLDGGMLDLGVEIRDFTLDLQNRVGGFLETFEAVAYHGVEALQVNMRVCPSGGTSAAVLPSTPCYGS